MPNRRGAAWRATSAPATSRFPVSHFTTAAKKRWRASRSANRRHERDLRLRGLQVARQGRRLRGARAAAHGFRDPSRSRRRRCSASRYLPDVDELRPLAERRRDPRERLGRGSALRLGGRFAQRPGLARRRLVAVGAGEGRAGRPRHTSLGLFAARAVLRFPLLPASASFTRPIARVGPSASEPRREAPESTERRDSNR